MHNISSGISNQVKYCISEYQDCTESKTNKGESQKYPLVTCITALSQLEDKWPPGSISFSK